MSEMLFQLKMIDVRSDILLEGRKLYAAARVFQKCKGVQDGVLLVECKDLPVSVEMKGCDMRRAKFEERTQEKDGRDSKTN